MMKFIISETVYLSDSSIELANPYTEKIFFSGSYGEHFRLNFGRNFNFSPKIGLNST